MQAVFESHASESHGHTLNVTPTTVHYKKRKKSRRAEDLRLQALAEIAAALLESQNRARIIVDASWTVVLANQAAHRLFVESHLVRMKGSTLECVHKKIEAELLRVLTHDTAEISFQIRVGNRAEAVLIRELEISSSAKSYALIDISIAAEVRLRQHFGLTPAEAEIARGIFHGLSLVKIAEDRCASINTVKTQVRYIFQKVGVRSKVSLARQIGELI